MPPTRRGVQFVAVVVGVLTTVVGSVATGLLLVLMMTANGIPEYEILPRMNSLSGLLLKLISVLGFTVLGGSFAAQLARQSYLLHGAVVAGVGLLLSLLCIDISTPLWYRIAHYSAMVPAGIAGGYLAKRRYRNIDRFNQWRSRS